MGIQKLFIYLEYHIQNKIILELLNLWKTNCIDSVWRKYVRKLVSPLKHGTFNKIKSSMTCFIEKIYGNYYYKIDNASLLST